MPLRREVQYGVSGARIIPGDARRPIGSAAERETTKIKGSFSNPGPTDVSETPIHADIPGRCTQIPCPAEQGNVATGTAKAFATNSELSSRNRETNSGIADVSDRNSPRWCCRR